MTAVIRIVEVSGVPDYIKDNGKWVAGFIDNGSWRGLVRLVSTEAEALRFPSKAHALAFWRQRSKHTPTRPDGKPNRPLTAYTVEIYDLNPGEKEAAR